MSRVPPPSLVFRVRFDRDHEAWRPCVCHSVTPGPADRSPTPPRTCTLRLCPYAAEPPRLSLARATKRALAPTTSQLHHHHRCPPPPSLSLSLSSSPRFSLSSPGTGQWNEEEKQQRSSCGESCIVARGRVPSNLFVRARFAQDPL